MMSFKVFQPHLKAPEQATDIGFACVMISTLAP